jgi:hypothetical protein
MLNAGQVTPEEIRDISVARKDMEHLVNMMARLCGPHRPNREAFSCYGSAEFSHSCCDE